IVQFTYGGDSLDPIFLEGKDKPVDYERVYQHVRAKYRYNNEQPLSGIEMNNFVNQQLQQNEYSIMGEEYKQQIIEFIHKMSLIVDKYRKKYKIDNQNIQQEEDDEQELKSITTRKRATITPIRSNKKQRVIPNVLYEIERCTKSQLLEFLQLCKNK